MTYHDAGDVRTGRWDDDPTDRHADEDRTYDPRDVADAYDVVALPLPPDPDPDDDVADDDDPPDVCGCVS
jgi:hypothetical protein